MLCNKYFVKQSTELYSDGQVLACRHDQRGDRYQFAVQRLRLDYIFWGIEEPYYTSDILPFLRGLR